MFARTILAAASLLPSCCQTLTVYPIQAITSNKPEDSPDSPWADCFDNSVMSECAQNGYFYPDDVVQVDLGTEKNVNSFYMFQFIYAFQTKYHAYVGNTDIDGDYKNLNTLCYTGEKTEGLANCSGKGRYLQLVNTATFANYGKIKFSELYVLGETDFAQQASVSQFGTGMTKTQGEYSWLVGNRDYISPNDKYLAGNSIASELTIKLDSFGSQIEMTSAAIFVGVNNFIDEFQVKTMISGGAWQDCGPKVTSVSPGINSVNCGTKMKADEVEFLIKPMSDKIGNFAKVGVFGMLCRSDPYTISNDSTWSTSTTAIDLLLSTPTQIAHPTLTISVDPCYTTTWIVYKNSGSTDMMSTMPAVFAITDPNLVITVDVTDLTQRSTLYDSTGTTQFDFKGTVDDDGAFASSLYPFTIIWKDDCRSSTIVQQTITLSPVKYDATGAARDQTTPAFIDTIDQANTYGVQGRCGEKQIELDAVSKPAWLSISPDVGDPILNPFKISYDPTQATEADITTHTISYTVKSVHYGSSGANVVPDISGTFSFQIICPDGVTKTCTSAVTSQNYDLASGTSLSITPPVITFAPAVCSYMLTGWELLLSPVLSSVSAFLTSSDKTSIILNSQDWSLKPSQQIRIRGELDDGSFECQSTFSINFFDTCDSLVPTLAETTLSVTSYTYDLLSKPLEVIAFPIVVVTPAGCEFKTSWVVKKDPSGEEVTTTNAAVFALQSSGSLHVKHSVNDFTLRKQLYGNQNYLFQGTVLDSHSTQTTGPFKFAIDFQDACRTASITGQTFTVNSPVYQVDINMPVVEEFAFKDSVDANNVYSVGICGEKVITIDQNVRASAFLLILVPTDRISGKFQVVYDQSNVKDTDVAIKHTVGYTVSFKEYGGIATSHTGSFIFEIVCPKTLVNKKIIEATNGHNFYDVANPSKIKILAPRVQLEPQVCFKIKAFELYAKGKASDGTPKYAKVLSDLSGFEISANDRKFVGYHELSIQVEASSKEKVLEHHISLTIYDSCNMTEIEASSSISELKIRALQKSIMKQSFQTFTDSVSIGYKVDRVCGDIIYSVIDGNRNAAPSDLIKVVYTPGEMIFQIEVDTQNWANEVEMDLYLRAQLENYPTAPPLDLPFRLTIEAADTFVFTPPTYEPILPKEEIKPEIVEQVPEPEVPPPVEPKRPRRERQRQDDLADLIRQQVITDQYKWPYPVPFIKSASQKGLLEIIFTKTMAEISNEIDLTTLEYQHGKVYSRQLTNKGFEDWKPVLTVEIVPSIDQEPEKVGMKWEIVSSTKNRMFIQMIFEQPLWISYDQPDLVRIEFADENLFISENGIKIPKEKRVLVRELMRQLPVDAQDVQEAINETTSSIETATMALTAINVAIGAGLQSVFSMIQALQILIMLPLTEASIPANAGMVYRYFAEIAAFDFFDIGSIADSLLDLESTTPVNHKLETIGITTKQFINNVGSFIFFVFSCMSGVGSWFMTAIASIFSLKATKLRYKLGQMLFWNRLNLAIFESILIVSFCSFISLKCNFKFDPWGQELQTWLAIICLVAYITIPLFTMIVLLCYFDKIREKDFAERFEALYSGLQHKNGRIVLLEPIAFLVRRLIIASLIIFGTKVFFYQMMTLIMANLLVLCLPFVIKSLVDKQELLLQTISEVCIMISTFCFIAFNIVSVEDNFTLGYFTIGVTGVYISICALIILRNFVIHMRNELRLRLVLHEYKKSRKQLQINLQSTHIFRVRRMQNIRRTHEDDSDSFHTSQVQIEDPSLMLSSVMEAEDEDDSSGSSCSDSSNEHSQSEWDSSDVSESQLSHNRGKGGNIAIIEPDELERDFSKNSTRKIPLDRGLAIKNWSTKNHENLGMNQNEDVAVHNGVLEEERDSFSNLRNDKHQSVVDRNQTAPEDTGFNHNPVSATQQELQDTMSGLVQGQINFANLETIMKDVLNGSRSIFDTPRTQSQGSQQSAAQTLQPQFDQIQNEYNEIMSADQNQDGIPRPQTQVDAPEHQSPIMIQVQTNDIPATCLGHSGIQRNRRIDMARAQDRQAASSYLEEQKIPNAKFSQKRTMQSKVDRDSALNFLEQYRSSLAAGTESIFLQDRSSPVWQQQQKRAVQSKLGNTRSTQQYSLLKLNQIMSERRSTLAEQLGKEDAAMQNQITRKKPLVIKKPTRRQQ